MNDTSVCLIRHFFPLLSSQKLDANVLLVMLTVVFNPQYVGIFISSIMHVSETSLVTGNFGIQFSFLSPFLLVSLTSRMLIGAPKEQRQLGSSLTGGSVYQCVISTSTSDCELIPNIDREYLLAC